MFFRYIFILLLIFTSIFAESKKIFILHSYSQEYTWTKKQHKGFIETLEKSGEKFDFFVEYLDTKRLDLSTEYQKKFTKYLNMKYKDLAIDMIYVTDDNALNYIYENNKFLDFYDTSKPIFFSGVNNLENQKKLSKKQFCGIYEVKEVVPNIELIKQFSPQTRDIWFVGDNSETDKAIMKLVKLHHKQVPNMNFHYLNSKKISDVISNLPTQPKSFIFITTIGQFEDENSNRLSPLSVIEKIKKNNNILISMEDGYVNDGVVGGYVTSGFNHGKHSAELILAYIEINDLERVRIDTQANIYMFNKKELINSRLVLSEYILRDATIINKSVDLFEDVHETLINVQVIIIVILLMVSTIVFMFQRKQIFALQEREDVNYNLQQVIINQNILLDSIMQNSDVGYWKLDTLSDSLEVSVSLYKLLGIDSLIYKDDPKLLEYFIHIDDKSLYFKNIDNVKKSGETVIFTHRFINATKQVISVKHKIYMEKSGLNNKVVGIITLAKN